MNDELQQDIERIAKLRGVAAGDYAAQARELVARARRLTAAEVRAVFRLPGKDDLRVFDQLPPRSRQVLRDLRLQTFSPIYLELLLRIGDEGALIAAVQAEEAKIVASRRRL